MVILYEEILKINIILKQQQQQQKNIVDCPQLDCLLRIFNTRRKQHADWITCLAGIVKKSKTED
jgi:hypothetical protein